jgi:C1A family cysteine protease
MAAEEYTQGSSNQAPGISGFGGHRLADIIQRDHVAMAAGPTPSFESLGIEDAEQLIGIDVVPGARSRLLEALGVAQAQLDQLIEMARAALPEERLRQVSVPAPRDLGFGVLPPTPEMRAMAGPPTVHAAAPAALPPAVNLIPHLPAIRNQQSRGTCVSFTLTALHEYVLGRGGVVLDLSEQHLYYETKLIDGAPAGCGTWQVKAMNALASRGECVEPIWPYDPNPPCNNHGPLPSNARPNGLTHRLSTIIVPSNDIVAYKTHLAAQRPVTLSIPVYNSWYQSPETRRSGRITMRVGNEASDGGHAVLLVGYQDHDDSPGGGYFIVRNSWGTTWAHQSPYGQGYGTIPYKYITDDAWEALTAMVPGTATDDTADHSTVVAKGSTVTIEVNPNLKITITS